MTKEAVRGAQDTLGTDHAVRVVTAILEEAAPSEAPSRLERQLHITRSLSRWQRQGMHEKIKDWGLRVAVGDGLVTAWQASGRSIATCPHMDRYRFCAAPDPDMEFHTRVFRPRAGVVEEWSAGDALEANIPAPVPIKRGPRVKKMTDDELVARIIGEE